MTGAELVMSDHLVVTMDYSHFLLETAEEDPELASELVSDAHDEGIAQSGGVVVIVSPNQYSFEMPLTVEVWTDAPESDLDEWDEVFEVHLEIRDGGFAFSSPTLDAFTAAVPSGSYYALVAGRGFAGVVTDDGATVVTDEWRIRLWPSPGPDRPRRLKAYEWQSVVHPPYEFVDDGLAAVVRLHEALDRGDAISGRRTTVVVGRRFPGRRRKMYRWFRDPCFWLTSGGSRDDSGFLLTGSRSSDGQSPYDKPDLIVPCNGMIEAEYIDGKSPEFTVSTWSWIRLPPDRLPPSYWDGRPGAVLVPADPAMTVRFELNEVEDDEDIQTDVRVEHANVPSEWSDDLVQYWRWALERADYELDISGTRTQ